MFNAKEIWTRTLGASVPSSARGEWLRWVMLAFGFWLIVVTRPLWMSRGEFPHVPFFGWGCEIPRVIDSILLVAAGVAALMVGCTGARSRTNRYALLAVAAALVGLILLDQHRAQPWAYQLVLMALILAGSRHELGFGLIRLLSISIYVHSAVSKLDWTFCTGSGRSFLLVLQSLITGAPQRLDAWMNSYSPLVFPGTELLIALGLIWPRTRQWALWSAMIMHALLIFILGPWGLNHSAAVLIWNLFFIAQNWIVFGHLRGAEAIPIPATAKPSPWERIICNGVLALTAWAVIWPVSEPWGGCDLWPAWGLYAQHGERLSVYVTEPALRKLPRIWQETAIRRDAPEWEARIWQLRPQPVSLSLTQAPLYPQNRFLLGVILALSRDARLRSNQISATWHFPANRWTGTHTDRELPNLAAIEEAAAACRWNTHPRL